MIKYNDLVQLIEYIKEDEVDKNFGINIYDFDFERLIPYIASGDLIEFIFLCKSLLAHTHCFYTVYRVYYRAMTDPTYILYRCPAHMILKAICVHLGAEYLYIVDLGVSI